MANTLRDLSVEQFRGLVRESVRQALRELLEDPDAGLALRPAFTRRLRRSLAYLDGGGKTVPAEEMARRLGLKW
jgi:hypothetical protein